MVKLGRAGGNFLKRHRDKIVTKRGEKFAVDRSNWMILSNIEQMYNIVYDEMVAAGVAERLESPVYCDKGGNEVDHVDEAFCKKAKVDTMLTYPNYVLFANESGCNKNRKKDGHIA